MNLRHIILPVFLLAVSFVESQEMQFDGVTRTYRVFTPSSAGPWPLVINMHGLFSNDRQQQANTQMDVLAESEGFMVVYPKSQDAGWNYDEEGPDEVGFISALIDKLFSEYAINLNRVYATGMSSGGFMSHYLGCQLSEKIAALASNAGLLNSCLSVPGRGVPVLQIHGTADAIVPYEPGRSRGVANTIEDWVTMNECNAGSATSGRYPDENSNTVRDIYTGCKDDVEVTLMTVEGAGHEWMGSTGSSADIYATDEVWNFMKRFTLDGTANLQDRFPDRDSHSNLNRPVRSVFYGRTKGFPPGLTAVLRSLNIKRIEIFNVSGGRVYFGSVKKGTDSAVLKSGLYILTSIDDPGITFKMIIE